MPLRPPDRIDLGFFSYGAFKPNEMAFHRIAAYVATTTKDSVKAGLYSRDGLPVILPSPHSHEIPGVVLQFTPGTEEKAYESIAAFEPRDIYKWEKMTTASGLYVNALTWRGQPHQESVYEALEDGEWSSRSDPVFCEGVKVVIETAKSARKNFDLLAGREWDRYFRCQMAYLLLFSAIERYVPLRHGPGLGPLQKESALGSDEHFAASLRVHREPSLLRIWDARDPQGESLNFDPDDPAESAKYFYQIRHNLSHRGKGAWFEAEKVRQALLRMVAIFTTMLETAWSADWPDAEERECSE